MRRFLIGLAACVALIVGSEIATVMAAAQLQPAMLGEPLLRAGALALYAPWKWASWTFAFGTHLPAVLKPAQAVGYSSIGVLVLLSLCARVKSSKGATSNSHGSARWATEQELREAGLGADGVVLCQSADAVFARRGARSGTGYEWVMKQPGSLLCDDSPGHVVVYAATRSGKGVGICLPTAYNWRGSAIIYDIKRELWALTAGWRSRFSRCLRFEPTAVHSVHYNPLFEVPRGEGDVREAMNIGTTLCGTHDEERKEGEHWKLTATELIVGGILHVLYAGELKSLTGVRELLASGGRKQHEILRSMLETPHLGDRPHPQVVAYATAGLNMSENERSGVFSTAISHLAVFLDPIVSRNTNDSDFRIDQLNTLKEPVSLYLVVPPSDKDRLKPLFRLMINQINQTLTRAVDTHRPQHEGGRLAKIRRAFDRALNPRKAAPSKHRLLYLLDEFDSLGKMPSLASAMAHVAGYGIKMLVILQSPEQLWATYGRHNAVLDNASTQLAFGVNSLETARMISALLGQRTEVTVRKSRSKKIGALWFDSESAAESEHGRALLTPDEVRTMPGDEAILLVSGVHPYRAKKVMYYLDERFRSCAVWAPPDSVEAQAVELPPAPSIVWRDMPAIPAAKNVGAAPAPASSPTAAALHNTDAPIEVRDELAETETTEGWGGAVGEDASEQGVPW